MTCPGCGAAMTTETLEGHLGTSVDIDLCATCQVFWFDKTESLQLSAGAVLRLFRIIGERGAAPKPEAVGHPVCPRCGIHLLATHDQQRNTRFEYLRCPKNHGRLITFVNFLREKDFIKPLSPQQITELRKNIQIVNCSSCGAPIDLARTSVCAHCGSPLSMLDMKQAGALVAELQAQEQAGRTVDPMLPMNMALARGEIENLFAPFDRHPKWFDEVQEEGLVNAGLRSVIRFLAGHDRRQT